jgi:hypothetical protein
MSVKLRLSKLESSLESSLRSGQYDPRRALEESRAVTIRRCEMLLELHRGWGNDHTCAELQDEIDGLRAGRYDAEIHDRIASLAFAKHHGGDAALYAARVRLVRQMMIKAWDRSKGLPTGF